MLHPDVLFDIHRSLQDEKLQRQQTRPAQQLQSKKFTIRDWVFWKGGDLLIAFGTTLKCQVKRRYA